LKVLFQTIGVLVHYNFALPYYLTRIESVKKFKIHIITDVFPILMGGYYYAIKSRGKLMLKTRGSGVNFIDSISFAKLFKKIVVKNITMSQYSVVHLNGPGDEALDVLLKLQIPKLFVLHGSLDMDGRSCKILEGIYTKVDAFVTVSFHAASELHEVCRFKPSHVIHHGVDIEIFNPLSYSKSEAKKILNLPVSKKIILWNARLSPEKRLETLLYALPQVIREFKDFLVLVKTRAIVKEYKVKILRLIKMLNLDNYVIFDTSWTTLIRMPIHYRATDVYVNTSTTEAFGSLAMLEAMACGTPTIANNASSNPEALRDGGLLYERNNSYDLAEKLLKVLTDDKLARVLGYRAYKRVKSELTLSSISRKYATLYLSL